MEQLRFDWGESAEVERAAETAIRAQRAKACEAAAVALGARPGEVLHRVAGTLAVWVDSPSQRARGLTGLRWAGTWAELAGKLECSAESVGRAVRRLRAAGLVETNTVVDDRGAVVGVCVELQMRVVQELANPANPPVTGPSAGPDVGQTSTLYFRFTVETERSATPCGGGGNCKFRNQTARPMGGSSASARGCRGESQPSRDCGR
jgi:hypothetical protein